MGIWACGREWAPSLTREQMDSSYRVLPYRLSVMGQPAQIITRVCWLQALTQNRSPCNFAASDVNWCAVASTYDGIVPYSSSSVNGPPHPPLGNQHDGAPYRAKPGDHVTYDCKCHRTLPERCSAPLWRSRLSRQVQRRHCPIRPNRLSKRHQSVHPIHKYKHPTHKSRNRHADRSSQQVAMAQDGVPVSLDSSKQPGVQKLVC